MKSSVNKYVVEAIRKERMRQNISQDMLAVGINKSRGFIGQVENPRRDTHYNIDHINSIARYLGVSPRTFLPEEAIEE